MGWRKNLSTRLDLSCFVCASYVLLCAINPDFYVNYLYQFSFIWSTLRGIYIIIDETVNASYGSYYDHDTGGYKSFSSQ